MTPQESQLINLLIKRVDALDESVRTSFTEIRGDVRGYRQELNGRLRKLETANATRVGRETAEDEIGERRITRRDIYMPLAIVSLLDIAGLIIALKA